MQQNSAGLNLLLTGFSSSEKVRLPNYLLIRKVSWKTSLI